MAKRKKQTQIPYSKTPYRDHYNLPNGFDEGTLQNWYRIFKPGGSGPTGVMRALCALIEEVAELKHVVLIPEEEQTNATPVVPG